MVEWCFQKQWMMDVILNMKYTNQKLKESVQKLLEQENEITGQIVQIEHQIDELESLYLERTWYDGNVYLGWNKNVPTNNPNHHHIKINIDPKEKLFSLSSITSTAFASIGTNVDRQLTPYGQQRFESKKKKRNKKRNTSQMRRPRPIRKKRRR